MKADLLRAWLTVIVAAAPEDRNTLAICALRNGLGSTSAVRCGCLVAGTDTAAHPEPLTLTGVVKHLRDHPAASGFRVDESRVPA